MYIHNGKKIAELYRIALVDHIVFFFINTRHLCKLKTIMQIQLFYFLSLRSTVAFTLVTDETL